MGTKRKTTPSLERQLTEKVVERLCIDARARARSIRVEAKPYWISNRDRMRELQSKAAKFDDFAMMLEELKDPPALVYPANKEL